jgi:hypothetical protein
MHAIGSTAPDLPPKPGVHAAFARDHEYKRHGTLSLLARIALVTGKVHAVSRIDIAPASSSSSYSSSILPIRLQPRSKLSSTTILPTLRRKPKPGSLPNQRVASNLPSPQSMAPGSISSKASSPSWACSDTSELLPNTSSRSVLWPPSRTSTSRPCPYLVLQTRKSRLI